MGKEVEPEAEPCIGFRDGVCKFLVILLGSSLIMALSYQPFLYTATADTSSSENAEILAVIASTGTYHLSRSNAFLLDQIHRGRRMQFLKR